MNKTNVEFPSGSAVDADISDGFTSPEQFFKNQFGGEPFASIIGELAVVRQYRNLNEYKDRCQPSVVNEHVEELKRKREERVQILSKNLTQKLGIYVESGPEVFRQAIALEIEELKVQNYGIELLHLVGYVYVVKSKEYLARYGSIFGFSAFVQPLRLKGQAFLDTCSTVNSALESHKILVRLNQAELSGSCPSEIEKLQAEAKEKGTVALWKGSKLEIQTVIKSVCDKSLSDTQIPKEILRKRSEALKIIGEMYQNVSSM